MIKSKWIAQVVALIFASTNIAWAQEKSSVDIQAIQTRAYEGTERNTFRAVLSVLQTNKYENIISDSNAGLITATLPAVAAGDSANQQAGKAAAGIALGMLIPFGSFFAPQARVGAKTRTVTVMVEEVAKNKTQVRVALKETEHITQAGALSTTKETNESDLTDQPELYQRIFEQIDKEIFIRSNR